MATTSKRKSVGAAKSATKPAAKKVVTAAAKKPATAKAATKPRVAKSAASRTKAPAAPKAPVSWPVPPAPVASAPVAPTPAPVANPVAKPVLSGEARFNLIQKHAYLIGEKDGFRQAPDIYWFSAESLVDREHGPR